MVLFRPVCFLIVIASLGAQDEPANDPPWRLRPLDIRSAVTYYIEPSRPEVGSQPQDRFLAERAIQVWDDATAGLLCPTETIATRARIRIYWGQTTEKIGRMQVLFEEGVRIGEVYVRTRGPGDGFPALTRAIDDDPLMRDTFVYRTLLHEIGHALGLVHTLAVEDAMHFGGDVLGYYRRQREQISTLDDLFRNPGLSTTDRARVGALYSDQLLLDPRPSKEAKTRAAAAADERKR